MTSLLGGGGGGGSTTQVVEQQVPAYIEDRAKRALGRAEAYSNEAYVPYTGQRVASFTPDQEMSFALSRAAQGSYNPFVMGGSDLVRYGATGYDPELIAAYENSYVGGVMDELTRQAGRNLSENLLQKVNDTFIGNRSFGGSGHRETTSRAIRDTQESLLGEQAKVLKDARDQAVAASQQAQGRALQAGQVLPTIGGLLQKYQGEDISRIQQAGGQQMAREQALLDQKFADFQNAQADEREKINYLLSATRMTPYQPVKYDTSYSARPNQLTSAVGTLGSAYAGYQGLKNGGAVKKRIKKKGMLKKVKRKGKAHASSAK